jgi:hypothetical protein
LKRQGYNDKVIESGFSKASEIDRNDLLEYKENQRLPGACNRSPGSKLLSITMQLHCGGHLGGRA